jgi:hypothetical protein
VHKRCLKNQQRKNIQIELLLKISLTPLFICIVSIVKRNVFIVKDHIKVSKKYFITICNDINQNQTLYQPQFFSDFDIQVYLMHHEFLVQSLLHHNLPYEV